MNEYLIGYIESDIIPRYNDFDKAHQIAHVRTVIEQSLALAKIVNASNGYVDETGSKTIVDENMVYTVAAYHDLGMSIDRATHHKESAKMMRADVNLKKWFTEEQINIMSDAVEDHRASSKTEPRSIYGKIVAEADRFIETNDIIRRTLLFGLANYPELDKEGHLTRAEEHLNEKYAKGGYLKLWIKESENGERLKKLQTTIDDKPRLKVIMEKIWKEITTNSK